MLNHVFFAVPGDNGTIAMSGHCDADDVQHQGPGAFVCAGPVSYGTHWIKDGAAVEYTAKQSALLAAKPAFPAHWDADNMIWVHEVTREEVEAMEANAQRAVRDTLMAATDWRVHRAAEAGVLVSPAWVRYRQALRDVTTQSGFPSNIKWPSVPKED